MDNEQRHELQENDLQQFLFHFNIWWKKHGTQTLLLILIVVAAVVALRWYRGKDVREREAAWSELASISSPTGLQDFASTHADKPGLAGYALLRASDQLGEQAANPSPVDATPGATATAPADQSKQLLDRSMKLAQQTVDGSQVTEPSLVKLNARMRLAADYETLGQWDDAKQQYEAIRKEAGPYKMLAMQADIRLQNLPTIEQPVTLPNEPPAPEVKAPEAPAPAPADKPANAKPQAAQP